MAYNKWATATRHVAAANGDNVEQIPVLLAPEKKIAVSTLNTTAAITFTAAQILGGLILRDPNGAARTDVLPTAANLKAAMPGWFVGQAFRVTIRNTADAAETITIGNGGGSTGVTISGTATIAQNAQKDFLIVLTSAGYTAYSMGSVTF